MLVSAFLNIGTEIIYYTMGRDTADGQTYRMVLCLSHLAIVVTSIMALCDYGTYYHYSLLFYAHIFQDRYMLDILNKTDKATPNFCLILLFGTLISLAFHLYFFMGFIQSKISTMVGTISFLLSWISYVAGTIRLGETPK